jgi:uncharacterized protein (DUF983 family)
MTADQRRYPPVTPTRAALACRCPRCGEGHLFSGMLTVRPACPDCGLDFSGQEAAAGPAVFVILLLGMIVGAIAMLRPLKAGLVALHYRHYLLHRPPAA